MRGYWRPARRIDFALLEPCCLVVNGGEHAKADGEPLGRVQLATRPEGRFEFSFTPTHGSWPNLIEGFFAKLARAVLRPIRVVAKHALAAGILAAIDDINQQAVVHPWTDKRDSAAC
jgi:hypothetical protein